MELIFTTATAWVIKNLIVQGLYGKTKYCSIETRRHQRSFLVLQMGTNSQTHRQTSYRE